MGNTESDPFYLQRLKMVEEQIIKRGNFSSKVIQAFKKVPRHLFVPNNFKESAYEDSPLPIGLEQTISQPYMAAFMTEVLDIQKNQRVLEIGTGSGYQTAILAELSRFVFSIEIREEFSQKAEDLIKNCGFKGVHFKVGDGNYGWSEKTFFDRIIVTAAPQKMPEVLLNQLAPSGKMVIPLGSQFQNLFLFEKNSKSEVTKKLLLPVFFVPMESGQIQKKAN